MDKKTIRDIEVAGKTVLVRVDFNVPRSKETGEITNDNRIVAALPTIKYLLEQSPKAIVLFSHLGKVKTEEDKAKNNLAVVAPRLAELLGRDVKFVDCTRGAELEEAVKNAENGQVILVQNTRYEAGESKNDPELGKYWASLGDVFVEDAFGSVHRAHASTAGIPAHLPSAAGFLVEKEINYIGKAVSNPERPMVAILGGAKVSDKILVIENLLKIADKVIIVPRVYTNKPRTTGEGYKGMVHQPDPEKQPNLLAGLIAIRKMHIHAIRTSGMTCADEMLYPENYRYLSDLLSYVAVGARSVEDQQHRLTVSGMEVPAGMKNPTSGDLSVMLNSVVAAQGGHRFIYRSWEVETTGNELAHTILRGAVNKHGEAIPNYHYEDLRLLLEKYQQKNLKNPAVIVDTNHSNSNKQYEQQVRIAKEVLHSRLVDPEIHTLVKGLMIESYIEPGNQKIGCNHIYGKSITDPCLGWEESEKLLYTIAEMC